MKVAIAPKPVILPCPVLIIGTYNEDGTPNIMNAAWGGVACSTPPCITISLRAATHSYGNIKRNEAFTVNIPSEKFVSQADYAGIVSGRDHNKFADTGLTHKKSEFVNAPIVMEFPYALECKLIKTVELGLHTMFIGEVMGIIADEEVLSSTNLPDIEKVNPMLFGSSGSRSYYKVGDKLGDAYSIGKSLSISSAEGVSSMSSARGGWFYKYEFAVVLLLAFIAGVIAKIPDIASIDYDWFYPRNISFIVFPVLAVYFLWRQIGINENFNIKGDLINSESINGNLLQNNLIKRALIVLAVTILSAIYINILPGNDSSDTFILASIHLPLFLWVVLGFVFVGNDISNKKRRLEFLTFNGDLIIITTVLAIAGVITAVASIGLFQLINIHIEDTYLPKIAIWAAAALPVLGTYLVQKTPQLVKNVSPVIAKIFTPLVLILLVIYLSAIFYTGKNPYSDRDFLIVFNLLLVGVMALIFFSIAESTHIVNSTSNVSSTLNVHSSNAQSDSNLGNKPSLSSKVKTGILFLLSAVTVVVNLIALSAIVFRVFEWGITPNRLAVLGSNLLILTNLIMVTYYLFCTFRDGKSVEKVQNSIALFLPIYGLWALFVTFIFPIIFWFN